MESYTYFHTAEKLRLFSNLQVNFKVKILVG